MPRTNPRKAVAQFLAALILAAPRAPPCRTRLLSTSSPRAWDGFKSLFPNRINLVSEVYREHHIVKPQPNLVVDSVSVVGGLPVPGQTFQVRRTIRNAGNEKAVSTSVNRFFLANGNTQVDLLFNGSLGLTPPNLAAGASNTAVADLTIPTSAATGIYTLRVCADSFDNVPESVEGQVSNCRGGDTIRVR